MIGRILGYVLLAFISLKCPLFGVILVSLCIRRLLLNSHDQN